MTLKADNNLVGLHIIHVIIEPIKRNIAIFRLSKKKKKDQQTTQAATPKHKGVQTKHYWKTHGLAERYMCGYLKRILDIT